MILSDQSIRFLCSEKIADIHRMIAPFNERTRYRGMTYGLSSAGYDVRVEFDEDGIAYERFLSPGGFILASTVEKFAMPKDIVGIVHDKSSWARRGLAVQNTVIEPGWTGYLTLELTNHGPKTLILKRGMPIAQIMFHSTDLPTKGYEGKYQDQKRGPVAVIHDK